MNEKRFGTLETNRLIIRNLEPADAEAFFAYKSLPECGLYQYWRPKTLDEIQEFILDMEQVELNKPDAWLQLAICLKGTNEMIGDIGIHFSRDGDGQAEIGYTLSPLHQGKGYATEAVKAILGYLFHELGMHRVTASVDPRNTPSAAVLTRLCFRQEAHFKKSIFMDGEWVDDCVYAMLEEEWNIY